MGMIKIKDNNYGRITDNKYFKQVTEITKLYDKTQKIYDELANLEKKGLKDSEEYETLKGLISSCLKMEKKYFSKIDNLNSKEMKDLIDQICNLNYEVKDGEDVDQIDKIEEILEKTNLYKTDKIKRLLARFRDYSLKRVESFDNENEEIEEEEENELLYETQVQVSLPGKSAMVPYSELEKLMNKYSGEIDPERTKKEIEEEILTKKIKNDAKYFKDEIINIGLLNRIEEEIQKTNNKHLKNILIDYKYNLIYTFETLEKFFALTKEDQKRNETIEIPVDFNELYKSISYKVALLAEDNTDEYQSNYNEELEEEIKYKITELKSKEYDDTISKEMNKLDKKIDKMYIESLISAIKDENALTNIIEYANVAENDPIDIEFKNDLIDIKKRSKEIKLKL